MGDDGGSTIGGDATSGGDEGGGGEAQEEEAPVVQKMLRCARMLWWTFLLVLAAEAQHVVRIPGLMGRTPLNTSGRKFAINTNNTIVKLLLVLLLKCYFSIYFL